MNESANHGDPSARDEPATVPPSRAADPECATRPPAPTQSFSPSPSATHPILADQTTLPLLAIPGYEILAELGRGGMGVVYQARHIQLDRVVALKMILAAEYASATDLARFRTEAEAIARLVHPNIVQVYDIGEHEGKPYFSLEYCDGGSLSQRLAGTPLVPREAADLVEKLALAMHTAHERGVIHRDLKPANILLAVSGQRSAVSHEPGKLTADRCLLNAIPKITDFGLAKKLGEAGRTATNAVMGTPSYMAPEQAGGQGKEVGPAADIYALGATLYECLTGRPPFQGPTPLDTVMQVVADEPVPPRQLQPRTPRDLETICLKCLQKEAGKRYESAGDLAEDLRRFQAGEPIVARPINAWARAVKWAKRRPAVASLLAALVLALIGLVVGGTLFSLGLQDALEVAQDERGKAKDAREHADEQKILAQKEKAEADAARIKAEWLLYASRISLAQLYWQDNNAAGAFEALDACRWDFRGWEHRFLWTLFNSNQKTLAVHSDRLLCMAVSHDGKRVADGSNGKTVKVWDAVTGQELLSLDGDTGPYARVLSVAFSPNGKLLASSGNGEATVKVWDAATGRQVLTLNGHTTALAFSPDGKRLASGSSNKVKVWDSATGQEVITLTGHRLPITTVAFSPDGKRLAGGSDGALRIWDAARGNQVLCLGLAVSSVAYSPDGKHLAGSSGDKVKVWDAATGKELLTLKGHRRAVTSVAFSPNGKRLGSGSHDQTLKVWNAVTGEEVVSFKGHTNSITGVAFSPDGKTLISGSWDKTLKAWNAAGRQEILTLNGNGPVTFSRDGKRLAACSGHKLKVWDATTGQVLIELKGHPGELKGSPGQLVTGLAFSPDGERLASVAIHSTFSVWNAVSGQEVLNVKGHTNPFDTTEWWGLAFSPGGKRLATAGSDGSKVWDAATGQEILRLNGNFNRVAFSPDGKRLASGGRDGRLCVWDAATGQQLLDLKGHRSTVIGVTFSLDGKRLASSSYDNTIKIWDAATGQERHTLKGHTVVGTVAFSPDSKQLASGDSDGTLRIWDAATGQEVFTFRGHINGVTSVAFSPDGKRLASSSADGTLKVWDGSDQPSKR